MSLNSAEINLIIKELNPTGNYVQKIIQPDFHSLIFAIYSASERYNLIVSMKPGTTRIHRYRGRIPKAEKLQRFSQFLRSRILGGKITEFSQPGNDRIVKMTVSRGGEPTTLWIRLWGGNSNIIAVDRANIILDSYYRRPARNEVSGAELIYEIKEKDQSAFKVRPYPQETDFNTFIDRHYYELEYNELLKQLREQAAALVSRTISRLEIKLAGTATLLEKYGNFEQFRQYGELILSNCRSIGRGDSYLETENYYNENEIIRIPLDTRLTPGENSEKYFHRYKKAKNGLELLKDERQNLESRLKGLETTRRELSEETDISVLREWLSKERELQSKVVVRQIPGLQFTSGGFSIYAGRTAKENDELLRKHVRGNDYWLHTRDYPGGYIFIRTAKGKSVPLDTLLDAGNLAVHFSKGKNNHRADVYYTQVKYLRRAKDGPTGLVIPTQEKNLSITRDEGRLKRLLGE